MERGRSQRRVHPDLDRAGAHGGPTQYRSKSVAQLKQQPGGGGAKRAPRTKSFAPGKAYNWSHMEDERELPTILNMSQNQRRVPSPESHESQRSLNKGKGSKRKLTGAPAGMVKQHRGNLYDSSGAASASAGKKRVSEPREKSVLGIFCAVLLAPCCMCPCFTICNDVCVECFDWCTFGSPCEDCWDSIKSKLCDGM